MKHSSFIQSKSMVLYVLIFMNLLLLPFFSSKAVTAEEGIRFALETVNAEVEEININAHVNVADQFITRKEAVKIGLELARTFALKNHEIEDVSDTDHTQIIIRGSNQENRGITIILQASRDTDFKESNIVIDVIQRNEYFDITALEKTIKDALRPYGRAEVNTCITSFFNGKLSKNEREKIANKIMKTLGAREVEGIKEENMISIAGFADELGNWIQYGGKRVNIHIAMRYNAYEDRTYLWIANPLIAIGY